MILGTWQGFEFFGVGIPFGIVIGIILYLTNISLSKSSQHIKSDNDQATVILLISLVSAIIAHFVEINFGIAIVSTWTLFWIYSGLILVLGYIFKINRINVGASIEQDSKEIKIIDRKRKKRSEKREQPDGMHTGLLNKKYQWLFRLY